MPLDPSIPLSVRPPQLMNLEDIFARQQQQQHFQTQQRLATSELETARLGQKQAGMAIAGQEALNDAYKQPGVITTGSDGIPTVDPNAISSLLAARGQGHLIPSVSKAFLDMQTAAGKVQESRSKLAAEEADYAGHVGAGAKEAGYDPEILKLGLAHAAQLYGPNSPSAQALQALSADPTKAQSVADHLIANSPKQQQLTTSARQAGAREQSAATAAARLTAETPKIAAEVAAAEQRVAGTQPIQPAQAAAIAATAGQRAEIARHNVVEEKQGAGRLTQGAQRLKLEQEKAGFEQGGGISAPAKMAAEGKMDPQTLRAMLRRSPGLISQIKQADPNFDEADIDKRYATLKEFTSSSNSKAGGQVMALNTLIQHADLYQQTAEALKNGTFVPGNAVYNAVASAFGSAPPTQANLVARFFAGETGKVATGGVPAEGEINGILKNLGTSASPEQIAGAGKTLLSIAAGRAIPLMEKAKDAKLENVVHVLGPDAKEILTRRGFDPATMRPVAQTGGAQRGAKAPPAIGTVQKGYRFNGGNPADQASWERVP